MEKKQELARKNMYMSQEVAQWYVTEADKIGVSQSALMAMVLSQYIDQKKAMDMGETMKQLLKIVEENKVK